LNDVELIFGTLDELGVLGVLDVLDALLPQPAATSAAHAAAAVRAILLLSINFNETPSLLALGVLREQSITSMVTLRSVR